MTRGFMVFSRLFQPIFNFEQTLPGAGGKLKPQGERHRMQKALKRFAIFTSLTIYSKYFSVQK